jgi:hypothetical protein
MWHAWQRRGKCTGFWWERTQGKRPLGRPRRRWEDRITMDLRAEGIGRVDSVGSEQGPVAGSYENGDEHPSSGAI